jgi:hypothetical protein
MSVVFDTVAVPRCVAPISEVSASQIISFGEGVVLMPMTAEFPASMVTVAVGAAKVHVGAANAGGATATRKTTIIDDVSRADARSLLRRVPPESIGAGTVLIPTSLSWSESLWPSDSGQI